MKKILDHIIEKGLTALKQELEMAVAQCVDFVDGYRNICNAVMKYRNEYPHSAEHVKNAKTDSAAFQNPSAVVQRILLLGTEIN